MLFLILFLALLKLTSTKPAKDVKIGDRLHIRPGNQNWEVVVQGLNEQRHTPAEAQLLYQEPPDSEVGCKS